MRVTVLRGISGAGKSTWVKNHASDAVVVSADDYFMVDGVYRFDPTKLQENHRKCFRAFMEAVLAKKDWIVVDNTNIQSWEYAPYVLAGEAYGYEAELLTLACTVDVSLARKERVPADQLRRTFEELTRETERMPRRFKTIHRVLEMCDTPEDVSS